MENPTHERSIPHLLASRMSESASTNTFRSMSLRSSLLANASIPSNMITLAPYIVLWVAKPNMCTWSLITIAISVIKNQHTNTRVYFGGGRRGAFPPPLEFCTQTCINIKNVHVCPPFISKFTVFPLFEKS